MLEITESVLVQDAESVIATDARAEGAGRGFAVDDFGTGYSSLSYLKRFPIDILKVDKSFVDDVGDSAKAAALAKAIVQLGSSLNLRHRRRRHREGPPSRRPPVARLPVRAGFFFARPVPADEHGRPPAAHGLRRAWSARARRGHRGASGMTTHYLGGRRPGHDAAWGRRRPSEPSRPDSRWADLERLRSSHPMMDAVIDEVRGRRIRIGNHWLSRLRLVQLPGLRPTPRDHRFGGARPYERWGTHPSWSRLLGSPRPYVEIEERLTELLGAPDTLVLPTITLIHASVIPALAGQGAVLVDAQAHKTIYEGAAIARGAGATAPPRPGQRPRPPRGGPALAAVRQRLEVFCIDGVNSMTGNAPDLPSYARICRELRRPALRRRCPRVRAHRRVADARHALRAPGQQHRPVSIDESYDNVVLVAGFSKSYSSLAAFLALPDLAEELLESGRRRPTSTRARRRSRRWPPSWPASRSTTPRATTSARSLCAQDPTGARPDRRARAADAQYLGLPGHRAAPRPRRRHRRGGRFLFDRGIYVTLAAYPLVPGPRWVSGSR